MTPSPPRPTPLTGMSFAAGSALSFSMLSTSAVFAYNGGTEPATLIAARAGVALVAAVILVRAFGVPWRVQPENIRLLAMTSIGQLLLIYGYMTSVLFIPVSLAVLVFYHFPILVLLSDCALRKRRPGFMEIAVFAGALVGLVLALGPSFDDLDWRGLAAAATAAAGGVILMQAGSRLTRRVGALPTFLHTQVVVVVLSVLVVTGFGGPDLPDTPSGWLGLAVACGGYVFGVSLQFVAFKLVPPPTAALIYNLEPLATMVIAAALLSERLGAVQYAGGALVLAAIVVAGQQAVRSRAEG